MVDPGLFVVVEAGAVGEVEPRLADLVPVGLPLGAAVGLLEGEAHLVGIVEVEDVVEAGVDGLLGQHLELLVRPEQVDLHAGDHLGDAEVGDRREGLLAEPEEVEVGGVAQVEELEVVLPRLEAEVLESVVLDLDPVARAGAEARRDDVEVLHLGQRAEVDGLDLVDVGLHLAEPVVVQLVPVGEVVPGPFHELGHPRLDAGAVVDRHRREERVPVEHAEVDAVGRRDAVVAAVELAQRGDRHLDERPSPTASSPSPSASSPRTRSGPPRTPSGPRRTGRCTGTALPSPRCRPAAAPRTDSENGSRPSRLPLVL